jgi:hypothetical protein
MTDPTGTPPTDDRAADIISGPATEIPGSQAAPAADAYCALASAFAFNASNSACVIVPESRSSLAFAMS